MDPFQLLGYILGGSGISAWIMTYWQLREQRRQQAQQYLRELIITPDFIKLLASYDRFYKLSEEVEKFDRTGSATILKEEKIIKVKNHKELINELDNIATEHLRLVNKISLRGLFLLLPDKLNMRFGKLADVLIYPEKDMTKFLDQFKHEIIELGHEIKKILGITILE